MGKLLKIIVALVAVAFALVLILALVLPFIIDPNDYKDEIAAAVEKQTGRTLTIAGDIGLSVFPWLGLDIGRTRLSNAEGFGDQPMASMEEVQVRVKLLPLLRKELEMDTVRLNGLQVYLAKDAQGRTNWADLQGEAPGAPEADAEGAPAGSTASPLAGLAIGGVEVSDAQIVWDDRSTGSRYEIDDLAFSTGAVQPGEPFDLELHFRLASREPVLDGEFDLQGRIDIAPSLQALAVEDTRLDLDLQGESLPAGRLKLALQSDIAVDLEQQTLEIPDLKLELLGLVITGNVTGSSITAEDAAFAGVLEIAEFVPRDVIQALGQQAPVTADASVLGKADARLVWEASHTHLAANAIRLRLDDTSLNGNATLRDFDKPAIRFTLEVDAIDLDRYLPPAAEGSAPAAATPAQTAAGGAGALPLDTLRGLNLAGNLKLGRLKAYNLKSTDIEVGIKAQDGVVRIHPAGARMYDGQYQGDIGLDVRQDTPRLSLNERLDGIQSGPLLKDLTGEDTVLGRADLRATLSGAGATPEQLRRTLNGNAAFAFTDGAVKGVNIAALIRNAQAKLQGKPAPATDQPDQTDFAELKGTATVTDGVVKNDDLSLQSPLLRISGKGKASLPEETIDYLLTTKIVGSLEGQGGKALDELRGIAIPVRIGGTFSKPTYTPDLAAALGDTAKQKAKEKIEKKAQDLIKDKMGDGAADQLLKGLFQ